ncbi:translation initiation factor IF-6 [Candidatus Woesearchaeota archaeon]|nr:translation initiation factor IF-6 [Candidatus Woesearchaeota archaeon]
MVKRKNARGRKNKMRKHAAIMSFHGDPNIGLYGVATDKFCLLGRNISKKQVKTIKEVLDVPVIQIGLYGTDLVGLFAVANSKVVLLPEIIFKSELKKLKAELTKLNVDVKLIKTEHTALGNNILLNDKISIISSVYSNAKKKQIEKIIGVKLKKIKLSGLSIPGSIGVITNKGGIFTPHLTDADIKKVEKLLGFEIGLGTVNLGNPFISSGIIANSNGFIVGDHSSGYEIGRIDESLGFLK